LHLSLNCLIKNHVWEQM